MAPRVPAGARPHLEVQVASVGAPGLPDVADRLAGRHALALGHERRVAEVHVRRVSAVVAGDDEVVLGAPLEVAVADAAAVRRDERRPAAREDVLTVVPAAPPNAAAPVPKRCGPAIGKAWRERKKLAL